MRLTGCDSVPGELSWEAFQEFFLEPGKPKAIRLTGKVPATLFVSEAGRSMGLRLPASKEAGTLRSPMRQLHIEVKGLGKASALELWTAARPLYKEFFLFAMDIADAVQRSDVGIADAVDTALRSWRELLQRATTLSAEAELGLIGELLTLQRLVATQGDSAVDSWTGPLRQRHDFRLQSAELEVKTTSAGSREHFINGWEQLVPSKGMALYVVSIQLERAGNAKGFSLPAVVDALSNGLGQAAAVALRDRLESCGYADAEAVHYTSRFKRRSPDRLILVDDAFPRIIPKLVTMQQKLKHRIKDIHYRVNVDGLGIPDTDRKFAKIFR